MQADVADVSRLEREVFNRLIDAPKQIERAFFLFRVAPARQKACAERAVCDGFRVALSQVWEHVFDIGGEHRVGAYEEHLFGAQRAALLVKQVGDALHEHARLAAAGNARDEQRLNILMADDDVLLLLDGGGDGLHVLGALARQRMEQQ